jgi:hypothetical protein
MARDLYGQMGSCGFPDRAEAGAIVNDLTPIQPRIVAKPTATSADTDEQLLRSWRRSTVRTAAGTSSRLVDASSLRSRLV